MIDWIFRPSLNLADIFFIIVIAEWIIPVWGLWSLLFLFILFLLSTAVERKIWKVVRNDQNSVQD
jgi:hypothetical protein